MAVIKPSVKFEGSELNLNASATPYIKEGVRRAVFNKTTNQDGAYLYFLPAFRADSAGNGVWYKKFSVRDNFGTSYKEKYYVANRAQDPAEYFANNFRILYPEDAKVKDVESNGRKFKQYPACGRIADRVVYNVAFAQNLSAGAHVLDLPLRNGADILMAWQEGRDMMSNLRAPINDPERCVPVFVKLKDNSANPWMLQVESSNPVQLPEQLADSDYLYNLDDIFVLKSKEEIIAKLREMYSSDVFDDCMDGYPGLTKSAVQGGFPKPSQPQPQKAVEVAKPAPAPVIDIPKAVVSAPAVVSIPVAAINPPAPADISSLPPNPMAGGRLSREEALRFIAQDLI